MMMSYSFFCLFIYFILLKSWMKACENGRSAGQNFASENFLSYKTLTMLADIKAQFLDLIISIGFIPSSMAVKRKRTGVDKILEITGPEVRMISTIILL